MTLGDVIVFLGVPIVFGIIVLFATLINKIAGTHLLSSVLAPRLDIVDNEIEGDT